MKKGKLNLPTGEIGGQKAPKLSKKEAIAAYLETLKQLKLSKDKIFGKSVSL